MSDARAPIAVYADESCLGNGREGENPGGAAGMIEARNARTGAVERRDYWVSAPATTNNRMAIRSAIEALRIVSAKGERRAIVFTSDSQYLVKGMREWVPGWIRRGWRRKGGALENVELWQELDVVRARGRQHADPDPLPAAQGFRPSPALPPEPPASLL